MPASQREQERVATRRVRVLRLRVAGMTFDAIAEEIERERQAAIAGGDRREAGRARYTGDHAFTDFKRALAGSAERLAELADLNLALDLERLDVIYRAAETVRARAAQASDGFQQLRALDRQLAVIARRDSLLGLSATSEAALASAAAEGKPGTVSAVDELARKRARRSSRR